MPTDSHYWVNKGIIEAIIHIAGCRNCHMDNAGRHIQGNRDNWLGPYATIGSALDGARLYYEHVREALCCGTGQLISPTSQEE